MNIKDVFMPPIAASEKKTTNPDLCQDRPQSMNHLSTLHDTMQIQTREHDGRSITSDSLRYLYSLEEDDRVKSRTKLVDKALAVRLADDRGQANVYVDEQGGASKIVPVVLASQLLGCLGVVQHAADEERLR